VCTFHPFFRFLSYAQAETRDLISLFLLSIWQSIQKQDFIWCSSPSAAHIIGLLVAVVAVDSRQGTAPHWGGGTSPALLHLIIYSTLQHPSGDYSVQAYCCCHWRVMRNNSTMDRLAERAIYHMSPFKGCITFSSLTSKFLLPGSEVWTAPLSLFAFNHVNLGILRAYIFYLLDSANELSC
jgi:hypothetical protein